MNGILLIHKPSGYTSHDVVNKLRKILHTKKVGHCGTLDPDATGVLVVCINKATKVLQFLTADTKEYIATLSLGVATDTYDASGSVMDTKEYQGLNEQTIIDTIYGFLGTQKQIPPMYSAVKVNGKKLYEYARKGETIEVAPRQVTIEEIEVLTIDNHEVTFRVVCSKGTYIRSLCVDIAKALGYPGHMKKLIRTMSGQFMLEDCYTLEQVEQGDFTVRTIEEALSLYPQICVEDETVIFHGKKIPSDNEGLTVICNKEKQVLAMYGPDGNGYLKSVRGLW